MNGICRSVVVLTIGGFLVLSVGSAIALSPQLPDGRQRAFPTAEGKGAAAVGGRGGQVMFVTNTNDGGSGSLRECVEASGARTCIFRVSGTILLGSKPLRVLQPNLTIAGETAPGDGIAIQNSEQQILPSLQIQASNVIVRHIRLRPGPAVQKSCCSGALGIYGRKSSYIGNIILDHVSMSWGADEIADSQYANDITFQWNMLSEPLLNGAPRLKRRARNMLLTLGGNFSVHHSLFAFGQFRNPQIMPSVAGTTNDVINNVLYSPQWEYVVSFVNRWTAVDANVIGNYKVAGLRRINDRLVHLFNEGPYPFSVYLSGNVDETYIPSASAPQSEAMLAELQQHIVYNRMGPADIAVESADAAYSVVLAGVGATKPRRDSNDARIVNHVVNRTGNFILTWPPNGWPNL